MTKRVKKAVPACRLPAHIVDLIQAASRSIGDLSTLTGYSRHALNQRLVQLEVGGQIHRKRIVTGNSWGYLWHHGPSPKVAAPIEQPRQHTVRTYPPVNRRDSLVEALFGPAGTVPKHLMASILSGEG